MKKRFYILLLSVLGLTACYEDKGNYDYNPIPEIELTGFESEYTMYTMDMLDIEPQFEEKDECNCMWTIFQIGVAQAPVDTLSTEQDLHYRVTKPSGTYMLALTVENRKTGDKQIFTSNLTVYSQFSTGCYILKEIDGKTDIDLVTPEDKLVPNILEGKETRLEGAPLSFAVCSDINYVDEEGGPHVRVTTAWIASDKDVRMLTLENMTPVYDIHSMFFDEPKDETPRSIRFLSNNLIYFSNNGVYNMALLVPTAMHKFGLPLVLRNPSTGDVTSCSCSKYAINGIRYSMFYDEQNQRFLACKNGVLYRFLDTWYGRPAISPNNMNSDLIYLCKTTSYGYALMYDKTLQKNVAYLLNTALYDSSYGQWYSPLLEKKELPVSAKVAQGEAFGCNRVNAYIYFSIGNKLNLFDYITMQEQEDILPGLDGKITMIKQIQGVNEAQQACEYLVVATTNNGHYKIYYCEMLAGKPDLTKTPRVVEGEGAVAEIYNL